MQRDELCLRMTGEDPVSRFHDFPRCSENHGRGRPVRMAIQFLKALVEAICSKKTLRVGDVNRDGIPNEPQASHIE